MRLITLTALVVLLAGCTWVKLTEGGMTVSQGTYEETANCRKVGTVSSQTQDRGVRSDGKVREELLVLARNEAARLGGDTIVPKAPAADGKQDFDAYRCK